MHSGFTALRTHLPHNCTVIGRKHGAKVMNYSDVIADLQRVKALWLELRTKYSSEGPYLFGKFSAADCMYAPVVNRFLTFDPDLKFFEDSPVVVAYIHTVRNMGMMQEYIAAAMLEDRSTKLRHYEEVSDDFDESQF